MLRKTTLIGLLLTISLPAQAQVLEADSLALVALYDSTDGANWAYYTWDLDTPVDTWRGVTVSGGRVTMLSLISNQLSGSIPADLGNLTNLTYLDLHSNRLTGSIPTELGNLATLTTLSLSFNRLSGSIPAELENLANLTYLNLGVNQLTGSIPAELGNLTSLTTLAFGTNQLSGSIPVELGNLANLQGLFIDHNKLTGSIPAELGILANLIQLDLHSNLLTGSIPTELGNLTNLQWLYLHSNQLTGSIPAELGNLTNLSVIHFGYNQLTGSIPAELGNLTNLLGLYLHSNQLTGSIPAEFGNLTNLEDLYLFSNMLSRLPDLRPLTPRGYLRVENNRLTFEGLESNVGVFFGFTYDPQDSVGSGVTIVWGLNEPLTLSVPVGGTANIYQWMKDGVDIPGATGDTLSMTSVVFADSGSYVLWITNTIVNRITLYSRPIHVSVVDDQFPVAVNDTAEVLEDSSVTILVLDNDSDPDGDVLMISDVTVPVHGTAVIEPGDTSITYMPATNFFGPDTFSYVIDDGKGLLDIGVVFITVTPVNDPPGSFALLSPPSDTSLFVRAGFDTVVFRWQAARDPETEVVIYFFKASSDYEGLFLADTTTDTTLALVPIFSHVLKSVRVDTFMVSWDITAFDGADTTASLNGFLDFTIIFDYPAATVVESLLPEAFALHQNYPNPFNPATTIRFDLPVATEVRLAVYDLLGREVVRLVDHNLEAGYHQRVWNGRDRNGHQVPTGIYFVLVVTPEFRKSIKTVLLK